MTTHIHEILLFKAPRERYGDHIALVYDEATKAFKVVAVRGMRAVLAQAEFQGEMFLPSPIRWKDVERKAAIVSVDLDTWTGGGNRFMNKHKGEDVFKKLRTAFIKELREADTDTEAVSVPVYLGRVKTPFETLLYSGDKPKLPEGYLAFSSDRMWN
ncbi:hypothetical protein HMN09_00023000 [Mycena chlorophos]|uniref:Uncharacterized protein n=1 Tax=Mycena chlorophos TaxID=658473 RepID=A0A8H6TR32_MYCCL|nr:hypothetical protein HMN09_00023000 [Mycena chlorophos]